jgi:uncharacterized protein
LRNVPHDFDKRAVEEIDRRLASIVVDHNVSIAWAIESGSRAWGFPSPDSDYDARFIYVRTAEQYLSPWQPRDVIEMPIEKDMDINGWDLGKAIKLMLKGNAVVVEWLQSPIVYRGDNLLKNEMLALAEECSDRAASMRHYFHLGTQQWQRFLAMGDAAAAKKLFYAARPGLCLRWLRLHGERNVPPMNFQILLHETEISSGILEEFEQLIAAKAQTRELGNTSISNEMRNFIDFEFEMTVGQLAKSSSKQSRQHLEKASALFRNAVLRFAPT